MNYYRRKQNEYTYSQTRRSFTFTCVSYRDSVSKISFVRSDGDNVCYRIMYIDEYVSYFVEHFSEGCRMISLKFVTSTFEYWCEKLTEEEAALAIDEAIAWKESGKAIPVWYIDIYKKGCVTQRMYL